MTNNIRAMVVVFIATVLLLGGLGLWVGYRSGDITLGMKDPITNHEFPKALSNMQENTSEAGDGSDQKLGENNIGTGTVNPTVTLKTNHGNIVLELYQDLMPITAGNFLALAQKDFYDGTKFHRVIDGFMIQGGDPNSKTDTIETYGTGGPGYAIEDEFVKNEKLSNVRGTIAMANSGPHSGGSQFFINLVDNIGLDFDKPPEQSSHPVFGKVIAGMDIVDAIAQVPTNERDVPLEAVVITDIVVGE